MKSCERMSRPSRPARCVGSPTCKRLNLLPPPRRGRAGRFAVAAWLGFAALLLVSSPAPAFPQATNQPPGEAVMVRQRRACTNLREEIPEQYSERYDRWKATFLSAEFGRQLWRRYACNPAFRLTIILSDRLNKGGQVKLDDYRWDEDRLVAATIVLGHRLDRGYPDQVYYPVLGSVAYVVPDRDTWKAYDFLAAAKIAHEFGHVDQAAKADPTRFRLQNELSQAYAARFISNGHDSDDPALAELADRMGGLPTVLTGQREYWAETYALRYLLDTLRQGRRLALLRLVRKSLASKSSLYYLPSETEWKSLATFD
jgi:hypothetical protein